MSKIIHFVDTAGSDEHLLPISEVKSVYVTAVTTVIVYFHGIDSFSGGTTLSKATLTTVSGKSDEVAKRIAERMADGRGGVYTVSAAGDTDISVVAFSEGA